MAFLRRREVSPFTAISILAPESITEPNTIRWSVARGLPDLQRDTERADWIAPAAREIIGDTNEVAIKIGGHKLAKLPRFVLGFGNDLRLRGSGDLRKQQRGTSWGCWARR